MAYVKLPIEQASERYGLPASVFESYSTASVQPYALAVLRTMQAAQQVSDAVSRITITDPCEAASGLPETFSLGQITIHRDTHGVEKYWVRCL
jgi:hypothetical protein